MNRIIKFRIWDLSNKEWLIGNYVLVQPNNEHYLQFIYPENYVIQQFTGLKDNNGKEIYEGDIYESDIIGNNSNSKMKFEVKYIDTRFTGVKILEHIGQLLSLSISNTKIIGNIFENPELLDL